MNNCEKTAIHSSFWVPELASVLSDVPASTNPKAEAWAFFPEGEWRNSTNETSDRYPQGWQCLDSLMLRDWIRTTPPRYGGWTQIYSAKALANNQGSSTGHRKVTRNGSRNSPKPTFSRRSDTKPSPTRVRRKQSLELVVPLPLTSSSRDLFTYLYLPKVVVFPFKLLAIESSLFSDTKAGV